MAEKPQFHGGTLPEKLRFTENDGYGWIDLGMLSSKLVELARKLARDGQNRCGCLISHTACKLCLPLSSDKTPGERSPATALSPGLVRVW